MSYADDLAKDRDKYLRQRNVLAEHIKRLCDDPTPKARHEARKALKKIDAGDLTVDKLLNT